MEFYGAVLCLPLCGDAGGHAHQRLHPLRQDIHAVFRYVSPVLPLFPGLPPQPAAGAEPALQLVHRHGRGLPGAHLLLSGKPPESSQCAAAGKVASRLFHPLNAHQTGLRGAVLLAVSAKALREEGLCGGGLQRVLCSVRLGPGLPLEHHVDGYLRAAAPGHSGGNRPAAGEAILPVHRDAVFGHLRQLLCGLLRLHFRGAGVLLL